MTTSDSPQSDPTSPHFQPNHNHNSNSSNNKKNYFAICVNDPGISVNNEIVNIPRLSISESSTSGAFPVERLRLKYVVALNDPAFLTARTHRENLRKLRKQQKEERRRQISTRQHYGVPSSTSHKGAMLSSRGSGSSIATPMSSRMMVNHQDLTPISEREEPLDSLPELDAETAQSGVRVEALKKLLGGDAIIDRYGKPMPNEAPWLQKESRYAAPEDAAPIRLMFPSQ